MSCTISGLEETDKFFQEISDYELKKIANEIGDINVKAMQSSIATDTGKSKSSIKAKIKRVDGGIEVNIAPHTYYYGYQEWGTSKDKKNIGRLATAIESSKSQCFSIAEKVIKR